MVRMLRGVAAVFGVGMLDRLERVGALVLLLSESSITCVAVGEVECLLLAVEGFYEHGELLALGDDEVEFFGGGGVGQRFGIEGGGGERVGWGVTGACGGQGRGDSCNGAGEHAVEIRGRGDDRVACRGNGEAGEEALGVGSCVLGGRGRVGGGGCGCATQDTFDEEVDQLVQVAKTGGGEALVGLTDEEIDVLFVLDDEGLNIGVVHEFGSLGLGQDEVGERDEADP